MSRHFLKITLNFLAVVLLISLIATPLYFARNFAKVAGIKSESKFLVVSQIEKFPNMKLTQTADKYTISFTKLGSPQAFLGILIINNPTKNTQTYRLDSSGAVELFFGEDLKNQQSRISVPASASVPISLFSGEEATAASQTAEFRITAESE